MKNMSQREFTISYYVITNLISYPNYILRSVVELSMHRLGLLHKGHCMQQCKVQQLVVQTLHDIRVIQQHLWQMELYMQPKQQVVHCMPQTGELVWLMHDKQ